VFQDLQGNYSAEPVFTRLKEDILHAPEGQKPFDVVAVFKIDRFARKLRILMDVLNFFEEKDIEFISATESIDTSTPFGRAMLGIMGVIAELELETIRERTQRGREQAILEGIFMGGHTPYGYNKDENGRLVVFSEEAEVVKKIYNLLNSDKLSPQKIADLLKEQGYLSPEASAVKNNKFQGASRKINSATFWRAETVRGILSDDIYTGIRYYNKSKKGKSFLKANGKNRHTGTKLLFISIYLN
jgi:DNA invertase Pin-like site-specific DNA recombinase